MSSAHRVNALLFYFLGHRHSHSPQYPSPDYLIHFCGSDLPDSTSLSYLQLQKTNVLTKANQYSSTLVKPNLTSEEKHVNDSNSALFYNLCSWTRSLIFIGTVPEMQPQNPFYHRFNKEVSPVHSTRALMLLEKGSSRLVMKKHIFVSEVLVPGMSRLFDCITLFSACHIRMYSNGIEACKLLDQIPAIEENSEILIPRL